MSDDAPRRREMDELQKKLLAVLADADSVQLPDGSTLTIDRNPLDGAMVRIDADGAVFRAFPPADAAPEGYPADLPFLPTCTGMPSGGRRRLARRRRHRDSGGVGQTQGGQRLTTGGRR